MNDVTPDPRSGLLNRVPDNRQLFEPLPLIDRLRAALMEDLSPRGDVTSLALVPRSRVAEAFFLAKASGVFCGCEVLGPVFQLADELTEVAATQPHLVSRGEPWQPDAAPRLEVELLKRDGERIEKGMLLARVKGPGQSLLAGERLALNLATRLSAIATQTAIYVEKVKHTQAKILDTRKTGPLWRDLERVAVASGGGVNHRYNLADMVLIKDNHLALWGSNDPAGAVLAAQLKFPNLPVEVEVVDQAGLENVCQRSNPDVILLDNFGADRLALAVAWCREFYKGQKQRRAPLLEASGGINLTTVAQMAETGVDRISVGALTHSVIGLDISLEFKAGS